MALMTQKAYAALKGFTPQYVNKLVGQGKIALVGKKVDPKQADAAIKAHSRAGRIVMPKRKAGKKVKDTKPAKKREIRVRTEPQPKAPKPDSATKSLTASRAQTEKYKALTAEREYELLVGKLLPKEQVLEAERRKNANIRSKFRRLARSLAPMLSRASSPAEVEQVMLQEIDLVLLQLSQDPLGMAEEALAGGVAVVETQAVNGMAASA
jgi:hypothetical protein